MSENKKLKIKGAGNSGSPKKLLLKKDPEAKGLKIKNNQLPDLPETPEPQQSTTKAPKGLTIKAAQPEPQQSTTKAPKGLTIKAAQPEPQQSTTKAPKGLTIKAAQPEPQQSTTKAPKGLTIKAAQPEPQQSQAPKGLTIKAAQPEPQQSQAPKGLTIKAAQPEPQQSQVPEPQQAPAPAPAPFNPIQTPPPTPSPNFQAPATSTKPPPPMPTGYTAPPAPQPSVNPQGPMFPTQGQSVGQAPVNRVAQGEPAINPQGPVFPTANQAPAGAAGRPPGTMPPPTHKKETSAPLSAIMGEVRAAKKIDPSQLQQAPIANKPEVVKVKKPAGFIKDTLGNEFSLIPKGSYYIGIENEVEEVKVEFTLGKYPITKEQYFEFIKESGTQYTPEELNQINKISPYPNCPAVMVSWKDAKAYCRWLREKTGEYYALPSIKEWEAAARSADGRIFPWGEGDPTPEIACFNDGHMEPQSTCSVDFFTNNLSPFGCVGMIGNVMEWTLDSFEDERKPHILKGGSWMSSIDFCNNVTPCMSFPEEKRKEFFGFRLLYLPKELYQKYKTTQIS